MANTKEVRKQISSIKNTQKITSAMEMVAASKIKKNARFNESWQTLFFKNPRSNYAYRNL